MPAGKAPHLRPENPCGVCWEVLDENDAPLLGYDLGCGSAEQLHWFCSPCITHFHACPLCRRTQPLCTAPPPRETQCDNLTLHTLRTLIAQNVWARDTGDSPDVEWLDVLSDEDLATPTPRPPWRAPLWALPVEGADPTMYVPDYEHYGDAPRGSLPPVGNLPDSSGPVSTMNLNNWRTTVVSLTTRLLFTFGWLVGDAEWATGVVRGADGDRWGDFFHRSRALIEGAPERMMVVYLTWRGIPLPCSLVSLVRRAQQPHVPPPRPGTYGSAGVARMMAGGARHHSFTTSGRGTVTITTTPPRSRATAVTKATNVFALAPSGVGAPQSPTATRVLRPCPTPTQPSTHHTGRRPPTPHGLRAFRHHRTPARHRAPDKNVHPNRRRNNTNHNTTQPQPSGSTGHHLPGGEPCPAPRIRRQQAPDPSNPLAPYTRKRAQAPEATQLHNPKTPPRKI